MIYLTLLYYVDIDLMEWLKIERTDDATKRKIINEYTGNLLYFH